MDPKLNWNAHCEDLAKSLNSVIFLLRRLADKLSPNAVLTAFHATFLSRATYAIVCWGHSSSASLIFSCQRRAVRAISGLGYRENCKDYFIKLKILTIPAIFILECVVFIHYHRDDFKVANHQYPTRTVNNLVVPFSRLNVTRNVSNWWGIKFFNALPENVRNLNRTVFKRSISRFLCKLAPYTFDEFFNAIKDEKF